MHASFYWYISVVADSCLTKKVFLNEIETFWKTSISGFTFQSKHTYPWTRTSSKRISVCTYDDSAQESARILSLIELTWDRSKSLRSAANVARAIGLVDHYSSMTNCKFRSGITTCSSHNTELVSSSWFQRLCWQFQMAANGKHSRMSPILSINFVARGKKGDPKEIEKLRQDIEDYKAKLKEEFGYQPHQQSWLSLAACFRL